MSHDRAELPPSPLGVVSFQKMRQDPFELYCLFRVVVKFRICNILTYEAMDLAYTLFGFEQRPAKFGSRDFR